MSLYRAYFSPGGVDPFGLLIDYDTFWERFRDRFRDVFGDGWGGPAPVRERPSQPNHGPSIPLPNPSRIKELLDLIESVRNSRPVGPIDVSNLLGNQINAAIDGIEAFGKSDHPCNEWYKDAIDALKKAKTGDCTKCGSLGTKLGGPGTENADKCREKLLGIGRISIPGKFATASRELAKACKAQCEEEPCEGKPK